MGKVLSIGKYQLKSNVLLAPMAGINDAPFRRICRQMGAGLTPSEMVVIKSNLLTKPKSIHRLDLSLEQTPISVQIAGSDPKHLAYSAQYAQQLGAQIIDINMGCPAKKVCKKEAGSALMKDINLVEDILTIVVNAVDIPVTLKTRTGWDREHKNILNIAKIAEHIGITAITIHGRTRTDKYQGQAEYDTIAQVVEAVDIPIIANGDIASADTAKMVLKYTNCAGIMVGRGTQGNPWLITQIVSALKQQKVFFNPIEKQALILQHLKDTYHFYGEILGVRLAKKHIFWYARSLDIEFKQKNSLGVKFWQQVCQINDAKQQYNLTKKFLTQWTQQVTH